MVATNPSVPARHPWHLWVVGLLALLWNSYGVFDYVATNLQLDFYVGQMSPALREHVFGAPAWTFVAWTAGVWGAFLGSLLLLLRSRWAMYAFALSIAGLACNTLYNFVIADARDALGNAAGPMTVVIWAVALALLAYSVRMAARRVLR